MKITISIVKFYNQFSFIFLKKVGVLQFTFTNWLSSDDNPYCQVYVATLCMSHFPPRVCQVYVLLALADTDKQFLELQLLVLP